MTEHLILNRLDAICSFNMQSSSTKNSSHKGVAYFLKHSINTCNRTASFYKTK